MIFNTMHPLYESSTNSSSINGGGGQTNLRLQSSSFLLRKNTKTLLRFGLNYLTMYVYIQHIQ